MDLGRRIPPASRSHFANKGFEAELSGGVLDGWHLPTGYTYQHTRDADGCV